MKIKEASFIASYANYKQIENKNLPEIAFIGRSNVGKSSLINMLTNKKQLAKTSGKPGKTRLINQFLIDEQWILVDLPGYGWAKIGKKERASWETMIQDYILKHPNLFCLFILIDSRHDPQKIDVEFINWAGSNGIPVLLILTKTDKISSNELARNKSALQRKLEQDWEKAPDMIAASSMNKSGKEELLDYIEQLFNHPG